MQVLSHVTQNTSIGHWDFQSPSIREIYMKKKKILCVTIHITIFCSYYFSHILTSLMELSGLLAEYFLNLKCYFYYCKYDCIKAGLYYCGGSYGLWP